MINFIEQAGLFYSRKQNNTVIGNVLILPSVLDFWLHKWSHHKIYCTETFLSSVSTLITLWMNMKYFRNVWESHLRYLQICTCIIWTSIGEKVLETLISGSIWLMEKLLFDRNIVIVPHEKFDDCSCDYQIMFWEACFNRAFPLACMLSGNYIPYSISLFSKFLMKIAEMSHCCISSYLAIHIIYYDYFIDCCCCFSNCCSVIYTNLN